MSEIKSRVTVDTTQVTTNLNGVRNFVHSWAGDIRGQIVGAFAAGAIINAAKQTSDRLSAVGDAASRQDFGVEAMQGLVIMAQQANVELAAVEKLLNSLSDAQLSVITDSESTTGQANTKALGAIGINSQAANKMSPEEFMKAVVDGLNKNNIHGRQGIQDALPFLSSKLAGVLNSLMDDLSNFDSKLAEYVASGAVVSKEGIADIKKASDDMGLAWTKLQNNLSPLITLLIRILNTVVTALVFVVGEIFNFGKLVGTLSVDYMKSIINSIAESVGMKKRFDIEPPQKVLKDYASNSMRTAKDFYENETNIWSTGKPTPEPTGPNINHAQPRQPNTIASDLLGYFGELFDDKIAKAKQRPSNIYTDSLLAKGNLLGQARGSTNVNYALEQLKAQKAALVQLQTIATNVEDVGNKIAALSFLGGLIP